MASGIENVLRSEMFLHPESDDEESFVVLGSSLPPESMLPSIGTEAVESIDTSAVRESLALTTSALSQLNQSQSSSSFPSVPNFKPVQEYEKEMSYANRSDLNASIPSSSVDLSPDEIQKKIDMLIDENCKLKDTLQQNNLAMKKQYDTLVLWQEDVMKVHQSHKEKFADTKKYIENLKTENAKLADALKSAMATQVKMQQELELVKSQLDVSMLGQNKFDVTSLKSGFCNVKEIDVEATYNKKIADLENRVSELQMERIEDKQRICNSQSERQTLEKDLAVQKQKNIQLSADFMKQMVEAGELEKILLAELKILKSDFTDKTKTVITQEAYDNVQEQLMAAQMHITKLELLKNEDREVINSKEAMISEMQSQIKQSADSSDTINALRAQLELYKSDFEAEKQAKEAIKSENNQIMDDLRNLQRRNQQLLEEVETLRGGEFVYVNRATEQASCVASAPQDSPPPPSPYACPLCMARFRSLLLLEDHVEYCLHNAP